MTGFRNIFRVSERSVDGDAPLDGFVDDALADPALAALTDELSALGAVSVPASARQRGLALVHEEYARQQERGALGPARGTGLLFRGRLALGSVAVVLAAFLGLVGLYGGGNPSHWAGSVDPTGSSTSPTSPEVSGSTATSQHAGTSGTSAADTTGTTLPGGATVSTLPSTTGSSVETGSTITAPSSTTRTSIKPPASSTSTSKPGDFTSTTARAVLTREQRENSARIVAMYLSDKVVLNDTDAASSVLAGSAGAGFVQLVSSLEAPYSYSLVSVAIGDGSSTRVLVEFLDRVETGEGTSETARRFYYEMKVDVSGALVTAIYTAPAR